jgi:hypothetical protein
VGGLHLQFGRDASTEVVVSWHTTTAVRNPRVMLGTPTGGFGRTVQAETRTYRDAKSNVEVRVNHVHLQNLSPDTDYVYAAVHDGASPELGTARTAPAGRAPLRFTSFGDQATPTVGKLVGTAFANDNLGSPAAAGNHENESGNGPVGYAAYQTYFALPDSGADDQLRGLWYAFTAGSMRVISLNNDDVCYQDGGNFYVHGYSGGAQKRWLETELADARRDPRIDWVIVCMHQTAVSTADRTNGADLGIRQEWLPLFDRYHVDLVVCGHEHHYERSHPIRGTVGSDTATPIPVDTRIDVVDTTNGTVHVVIGGGGTSSPSNGMFFPEPRCRVLTGVDAFDPAIGRKAPIYVEEQAPWSAFRDRDHPYGFVVFDVDPGPVGGNTTITATHFAVNSRRWTGSSSPGHGATTPRRINARRGKALPPQPNPPRRRPARRWRGPSRRPCLPRCRGRRLPMRPRRRSGRPRASRP